MAPTLAAHRAPAGFATVRDRLLLALHLGRIRPGDRFLSVRRLADMTGLNRKTVHRAYQELVREGYLDARPGSGTFVAVGSSAAARSGSEGELLAAVARVRAEATSLGLRPDAFAGFLQTYLSDGIRGLRVAVVECNFEQIGMIAHDLIAELGLAPRSVLLRDLAASPREATRGVGAVVTTDCHRVEVDAALRSIGLPVYRVALDPIFPQQIVRLARSGPVVMIVADPGFAPVFLRLLRQLGAPEDIASRVRVVDPEAARAALRGGGSDTRVWVSPLVEGSAGTRIPETAERIHAQWRLAPGAIDGLRARAAFDLSQRGIDVRG